MPSLGLLLRLWLKFQYIPSLVAVFLGVACAQTQPGASWPCFGQNSQGTSFSPFIGAQSTSRQLTYSFPNGIATTTGAIAADGTVFVGDNTGVLYALDGPSITHGVYKANWQFPTGSTIYNAPSIGEDGCIYLSTSDKTVYALSPSGELVWKQSSPSLVSRPLGIGLNRTIVVVGTYEVVALDGRTGSVVWEYVASAGSQPVFGVDGTLYLPGLDSFMYAINGTSGQLLWKTMMPAMGTSAAVGAAKMIYVGTESRTVVAFSGVTGSIAWQLDLPWNATRYWVTVAALNNDAGLLYLGTYAGMVAAVDVTRASLAWSVNVSAYPPSYAVGGDGTVYAGTDTSVLAFSGYSGAVKWVAKPGGQILFYPPFIGADGTVYLYSSSTMYLFQDHVPLASVTASMSVSPTITPTSSATPTRTSTASVSWKRHHHAPLMSEPVIIAIGVGGFVVVVGVSWVACWAYRRRQRRLRQLEFEITLDDVLLQ